MKQSDPVLKKLIIGQMALQGMNALTIDFFMRVYDIVVCENGVSCVQMARVAIVARPTAQRYARRLEKAGYLERCRWRGWRLSDNAITDPDLRLFADLDRGMLRLSGMIA